MAIGGNWDRRVGRGALSRRAFLGAGGVGAAAFVWDPRSVLSRPGPGGALPDYPFTLGVASGDPLPDGVVLWTRLAPDPLNGGGMPPRKYPVRWEVSEDESFRRIVRRGTEVAAPELAHSVHAEIRGLKPGREYYYRFMAGKEASPVGRTKTAPRPGPGASELAFAFASCQSWIGGEYPAYRGMAEEDLDFVVHLGDYIYERSGTRTLEDFRNLHALYKTSPDLQEAHALFPFIATFDDHEIDNNWADEISQDNEPRETFIKLRAAAFQAYYEHLPLRRFSKPIGPDMKLYRRFSFGDIAQFSVLDTRQYRDDQVNNGFPGGPRDPRSLDPDRTLTGDDQEKWLLGGMDRSKARWNVIAQQTIMAEYDYDNGPGESVNHDQWDGYVASRDRIFDFIRDRRPENPVVISGDWHCSLVNDLKTDFDDPGSETIATEFVGTSISSGCGWVRAVEAALPENPHVKFFNGDLRGYVRCSLDNESWRSDYRVVASPGAPATTISSWVVENGNPGAQPA